METRGKIVKVAYESAEGGPVVLASSPEGTVVLRRLLPGSRLPSHRHSRSDVIHQVMSGRCLIDDGETPLIAPAVFFQPRGMSCSFKADGPNEAVLLSVICPGVTRLDSKPFGSVFCPVCSCEIAVEEGDQSGDRIICPDCSIWMKLIEGQKGHVAERIDQA